MDWPCHERLRRGLSEGSGDLAVRALCESAGGGGKPAEQHHHKDVELGKLADCAVSVCSDGSDAGSASEPPGCHAQLAVGAGKLRRRCLSYRRLNGCYVLAAEVLGTIILIALCVVTANQARSMSDEVDTVALAALARSNPRAICVNASTDNEQGRVIPGVNLQLVPTAFKDALGRPWKRAGMELGMRAPVGLWNFPVSSQLVPVDAAFTQHTLAALYKCGLVRGAYHSQDLPAFVARRCTQCRIELGASLNSSLLEATWANGDDINRARAAPLLESKPVAWHLANVTNATLLVDSLGAAGHHQRPTNETTSVLMFSRDDFLPGLESADPKALDLGYDLGTNLTVMPSAWAVRPDTLEWMEASLHMSEAAWQTVWASHPHIDPRAVLAGTLRLDLFHTPQQGVPLSAAFAAGGGYKLDADSIRGLSSSAAKTGTHAGSVWLEMNMQTPRTAQCMAQAASLAAKVLLTARYSLRQPNGSLLHSASPQELGLTFDQLWLKLDANLDTARPYACAEGVDVTAADATAYLTRLDAYKSTAKSQYRSALFLSMKHQTAEDIYSAYTGALGAVFGSMALLVATLFVYACAFMQNLLAPAQTAV